MITLSQLIAYNKPAEAVEVMRSFKRYPVYVKTPADMATAIDQFFDEMGEKGVAAMLKIHPHREMILETEGAKLSADGSIELPAAAPMPVPETRPVENPLSLIPQKDYMPLMLTGVFSITLLLTAAIIIKR